MAKKFHYKILLLSTKTHKELYSTELERTEIGIGKKVTGPSLRLTVCFLPTGFYR